MMRRSNGELVHQPVASGQANTVAAVGGETILDGPRNVIDTGPTIGCDYRDADSVASAFELDGRGASSSEREDVACDLGYRCSDDRLIAYAHACARGEFAAENSRASISATTLSWVSLAILAPGVNARDTAAWETPARRATS